MFLQIPTTNLPVYIFLVSLIAIAAVLLIVLVRSAYKRVRLAAVVTSSHRHLPTGVPQPQRVINLAKRNGSTAAATPARMRPLVRDIQRPAVPRPVDRVESVSKAASATRGFGRTIFNGTLLVVVVIVSALMLHSSVSSNYQGELVGVPERSWYGSGWSHRVKLTVNHRMVAEDVTDFPVLVSVTGVDQPLFQQASSTGHDIVFTAADGITRLPHEIEHYDPQAQVLLAWVKVPQLSVTDDVALYLYYGNSAAAERDTTHEVWSNGYTAVYHAKFNTDGVQLTDSTRTSTDSMYRVTTGETRVVPGKIGAALEFNDWRDVVDLGDGAGGAEAAGVTPMTISAWVNPYSRTGTIIGKRDATRTQWQLFLDQRGFLNLKEDNSGHWPGHQSYGSATTGVLLNDWQYVAVTVDEQGNPVFYNDGLHESGSYARGAFKPYQVPAAVGARWSFYPATDYNFLGLIDTIRISSVVRSAGWLTTEHVNQAYPSVFLSVDTTPEARDTPAKIQNSARIFSANFAVLNFIRLP